MEVRNSLYEFTVFGRVDMKELFDEWQRETDLEDCEDPVTGWQLKYTYVFENDICVLLFENIDGATAYYRALFYSCADGEFALKKKLRFHEPDSFRVDALAVDKEFSSVFICRSNGTVPRDIYFGRVNHLPADREIVTEKHSDLEEKISALCDDKFAVVDGTIVLFVSAPEGCWIEFSAFPPHPFLAEAAKTESEDDESDQPGDTDDDDDEYGDIDGDGGDDDTACHATLRASEPAEKSAMEELNELIGLDGIKEKVAEIAAFAKLQKIARDQGRCVEGVNLNLSFLGNPGTAKTTVARLFARIMKENGLLSSGDLIEVGRADLVAKYTGQTAIKVKGVFKQAKGNVLFIDEAYSLVDSWENEYGDEAIATIVQEMENNRDDMIVIFAGYPDKMEKFLSRNPGLRSRVPFTVEFRDYSAEELTEIVKLEAKRRGYTVESSAEKKILDICSAAVKTEEFGNGRFSRNLVESAIMKAAARAMGSLSADADLNALFCLKDCDFSAPDNLKKEKKSRVIGFCAA